MKSSNFGVNLKTILEWLGISQAKLSWHTGLTPAAISQIVNGKREPNLSTIIAILEVIPVSFEKLVKG